jgi:flagellar motility protein MotE (MotC chaperone)
MKFIHSGWLVAGLAALLNFATTSTLIYLQRELIFTVAPGQDQAQAKPRFWSFRAEEVDALIEDLKAERAKMVKRQSELDKVTFHIEAERQELEKTRSDVAAMRDEISAEMPQIQQAEQKNLKILSQSYATMTPTATVAIFKEMEETQCVKLLALMKPDKVGAILQEMSLQDKDESMVKRAARISDKLRLVRLPEKPKI